jgi:hypothetical protein
LILYKLVSYVTGNTRAVSTNYKVQCIDQYFICNTLGVYHSLGSGFELKHDRLSGDDDGKVNLRR